MAESILSLGAQPSNLLVNSCRGTGGLNRFVAVAVNDALFDDMVIRPSLSITTGVNAWQC